MESDDERAAVHKDNAANKKSWFSFPRLRVVFGRQKEGEVGDVVEPENPMENHTIEGLIERAVSARAKSGEEAETLEIREAHKKTLATYINLIEQKFSFSRMRKVLAKPGVYPIFLRFFNEGKLPLESEEMKGSTLPTPRIRKIMTEVAMAELRWSDENTSHARTHELPFLELEKLMDRYASFGAVRKLFNPTTRKAMKVGLTRVREILLNPAVTLEEIQKIAGLLNRFSAVEISEVLESKNAEGYSAFYYMRIVGFNFENYPTILGAENHVKANLECGGRFYDYARLGCVDLLKELVRAGMDVNQRNHVGKTAEEIARENNHDEIVEFLADESRKGVAYQNPNAIDHASSLYTLIKDAVGARHVKRFKQLIDDFADKERVELIIADLLTKIASTTVNGKYKEMLEAALSRVLQLSSFEKGLMLEDFRIQACVEFIESRYSWNRKRMLGMTDRAGRTLEAYLAKRKKPAQAAELVVSRVDGSGKEEGGAAANDNNRDWTKTVVHVSPVAARKFASPVQSPLAEEQEEERRAKLAQAKTEFHRYVIAGNMTEVVHMMRENNFSDDILRQAVQIAKEAGRNPKFAQQLERHIADTMRLSRVMEKGK